MVVSERMSCELSAISCGLINCGLLIPDHFGQTSFCPAVFINKAR